MLVQARAELGPGHGLFIRGCGAGLSWRRGKPLKHLDPTTWLWLNERTNEPVTFQLLLDDQVWAKGDNLVIEAGEQIEIMPDFDWPEIPKIS
jgi:hypothetical protein